MIYDMEYRLLQATEGFHWGMDNIHLQTVYLREKAPEIIHPHSQNNKPKNTMTMTTTANDHDSQFLLTGIREGFRLLDEGCSIQPTECHNYSSLSDGDNASKVAKQILWEMDNGNYQVTEQKPTIVSALGAIPKPNGKSD